MGGIIKIPGIHLRERYLESSEVQHEVRECLLSMQGIGLPTNGLLLIESGSIYSVYQILACLQRHQPFCVVSKDQTNNERTLVIDQLNPFAIVGPEGLRSLRSIALSQNDLNNVLVVVHTSGSSGRPQPIGISERALADSANAHSIHNECTSNDVWLANLPLEHIGGLAIVLRAYYLKQDLAYEACFHEDSIEHWLKSGIVTGISLVPTMLRRLITQQRLEISYPKLRRVLLGGAGIDRNLLEEVAKRRIGFPCTLTYGMTETASQIATQTESQRLVGKGLMTPLPGIIVQISEEGEILIKSEFLASGVVGSDGKFQIFSSKNWFHTGDFGLLNEKNELLVNGRKSDVIVSGGKNIDPKEIEAEILEISGIKECSVVGIADEYWGERVVAAYSLNELAPAIPHVKVEEYLRLRLSSYKIPKKFLHLAEIPKFGIGKVDKSRVRSLLSE